MLTGELDIATAPLLHRQLRRAQGDGETVVIDLRGLRFIDCGGARLLLTAHRRARWVGGRLIVVRGPSDVERMFGLVGMDRQLELVDAQSREAVGSR